MDAISLYCWVPFHGSMMVIEEKNWCNWNYIGRTYSDFSNCTEYLAELLGRNWPSEEMETFFVQVHSHYFENCTVEHIVSTEPPKQALMAMIILSTCLVPFMVALVVWKNKHSNSTSTPVEKEKATERKPVGVHALPLKLRK
uniref:Receptor activity modifying protein 1 n=1 Tax=Latimeria chalumnae TaxID=7897 RepID=H3AAQ9_LATCH